MSTPSQSISTVCSQGLKTRLHIVLRFVTLKAHTACIRTSVWCPAAVQEDRQVLPAQQEGAVLLRPGPIDLRAPMSPHVTPGVPRCQSVSTVVYNILTTCMRSLMAQSPVRHSARLMRAGRYGPHPGCGVVKHLTLRLHRHERLQRCECRLKELLPQRFEVPAIYAPVHVQTACEFVLAVSMTHPLAGFQWAACGNLGSYLVGSALHRLKDNTALLQPIATSSGFACPPVPPASAPRMPSTVAWGNMPHADRIGSVDSR